MASDALRRFKNSIAVANRLLRADDGNNASHGRVDFFHASWAAYIASWDAYLKSVCQEYITKSNVSLALGVHNQVVVAYQGVHKIASDLFSYRMDKFNTPNFENSREFIIACTGADLYSDWRWDTNNYTNIQVRDLLNESVRVRHSFAHGFPVRNIVHLAILDGTNSITYRKAVFVRSLVNHLSIVTDKTLDVKLNALFGRGF
jgi:hypothetical protein